MKQHFRYLFFSLLMLCSLQVFALDEVDRFAKKCDLYNAPKSDLKPKVYLRKEKRTLDAANVPIRMSFKDCKSIKHLVQLRNGKTVTLESGFPTNENPDNKGESYTWNSNSPSENYWRFDKSGWEWNGFVLINKMTGKSVTETSECVVNEMRMQNGLFAIICSGAYENTIPTLYIVDIQVTKEIWSNPIVIQKCNEDSTFVSRKFEFINRSTLSLEGDCLLSEIRGNAIVRGKKWVKVKLEAQISEEGIHVKSNGLTEKISWQSAK